MLRTNYSLRNYINTFRYLLVFLILFCATNICAQKVKNAVTSTAVYNKIAFTRQQSTTDWDIWIMDSDGGNQQRLLDSQNKDMNPHFSPDGQYIVFTRTSGTAPNQTDDVYIINSDGTNATNLTADISESAVGPKFSWDGNKIAFFRSYPNTGFVLCVMNKDGTNKQYIRDQNNNVVQGDSPFFTPNDQWLVFQRVNPQSQQGAIYKIPVAGGSVIQMTSSSNFDELPRVSPDGSYVVFKHEPNAANKSDIARMPITQTSSDQTTIVNLTNTTTEWEDAPIYSYE